VANASMTEASTYGQANGKVSMLPMRRMPGWSASEQYNSPISSNSFKAPGGSAPPGGLNPPAGSRSTASPPST
jgi:hypothetical protein